VGCPECVDLAAAAVAAAAEAAAAASVQTAGAYTLPVFIST